MTRPLRDDPLLRASGLRLEDDECLLRPHDLPALKQRIQTKISAAPEPVRIGFGKGLALALGSTMVIASAVVLLLQNRQQQLAMAPTAADAGAPIQRFADAGVFQPRELPVSLDASPPETKPPPAPKRIAPIRMPPTPETDSGSESLATTLAEQMSCYERALEAIRSQHYTLAITELEDYLQRFPQGVLVSEASLSLLEALARAKRWQRTEAWAEKLLAQADSQRRKPEIQWLRAEALVHLGRCQSAARLFEAAAKKLPRGRSAEKAQAALATCNPITEE